MKIKYLLSILLLIIAVTGSAQRFKGGVITGLNASQIDGDNWGGYYKTGLVIGAFVNTDFDDKFGGQLEIKYSGKGSSTSYESPIIEKIKLNYVDIPVLVTYKAVKNLKIEAGISINYLFKAQYYDGGWFDDWDLEPNKLESALTFGVNYKFFNRFDLNARYSYSLFPVRSKLSSSTLGTGAWFNNVITFALYFEIGDKTE